MIEEAFEVATEFKFDVGQAVFNTDALKASVDKLSGSADTALNSLSYLAGGLVAHLGLGSGGLLSLFTEAVKLSEAFHTGSMGFLNSIGSNMNVLGGHVHGFNEQLESSNMLMSKISDTASKFGLNTSSLASMTQLLATPLAQRGKLGTNYGNGIELAKNAMIVGEATGLGSQMMGESILRGLSPGGSVMGKLFERLVNTQSFRGAGIMHPAQMANMLPDKKIDLLTKAMAELGGNAGYLNERLNSLTVAFNMIKNRLSDVLTPIGDALKVPLLKIFQGISDFLAKNGKALGDSLAKLIADIFQDPKKLLINLLQLKSVGADFKGALKFTELFLTLKFLRSVLLWLGVEFNGGLIMAGLTGLVDGVKWLAALIPWGTVFSFVMRALSIVLTEFIPVLTGAFLVLQGISKAKAMAAIDDTQALIEMAPKLAETASIWKRFFSALWSPFQEIIDQIAGMIEWIFRWSNYIKIFVGITEFLAPALEFIGDGFIGLAGALHGVMAVLKAEIAWLAQVPSDLMEIFSGGDVKNSLRHLLGGADDAGAFKHGFNEYVDQNYSRIKDANDSASKITITNNNHINATFNLKEQLEPDRVAFAVTQHLKKLVMDRTQASGQSIHSGLAQRVGNN